MKIQGITEVITIHPKGGMSVLHFRARVVEIHQSTVNFAIHQAMPLTWLKKDKQLENLWFSDKKSQEHACVHDNVRGEINYDSQGAFWEEKSNHGA